MARSVVGYINRFLNATASISPTGSAEPATGLPIATGLNPGQFQEFTNAEALLYSNQGVIAVNILTAGSGQTNGTFTATASAGGAVIQYVISGAALTSVTVLTPGGPYTDAAIPTFTIAAGGTPGTVQAVIGVLYAGVYLFAQLDPAVLGTAIKPGTPLYWLQSSDLGSLGLNSGLVTTATTSGADFAGVSIDPNFGLVNNYAYIQQSGKARCLFNATQPTNAAGIGDVVNTAATPFSAFTAITAGSPNGAVTAQTVGYALQAGTALGSSLVRITRYPARF